jgi:F-type H+-transporting ATPase subunit delta
LETGPKNECGKAKRVSGTSQQAMGDATGMAGRYARAIFDLALEQGLLDVVAGDFQRLGTAIRVTPDLSRLITSPMFTRSQQAKGMAAVGGYLGLNKLILNFLGLVAAKRRLFALPDMIKAYTALLAHHRGQITAQVTAARFMSDQQIDGLRQALRGAMKRDVAMDIMIDPALIGGIVVKVGSRMVDNSIRTKLANLKVAMKEVG